MCFRPIRGLGYKINRKHVQRLMRTLGLAGMAPAVKDERKAGTPPGKISKQSFIEKRREESLSPPPPISPSDSEDERAEGQPLPPLPRRRVGAGAYSE